MSGKLLIEQMTEDLEKQASTEKPATEQTDIEKNAELEKVAHVLNVVEQAQTLNSVADQMYKIAGELENENLAALAVDTYNLGERFGACLSKTASEDGSALEEAFEIAQDLNKVAEVYATIADEVNDENFSKLAEAVINISNEMTDEANEVMEQIDKEAGVKDAVKDAFTAKRLRTYAGEIQKALTEEGRVGKKLVKDPSGRMIHGDMSKAEAYLTAVKEAKGLKAKLRYLGDFKAPAAAYGGTAAALAAAGYGVKKATDK